MGDTATPEEVPPEPLNGRLQDRVSLLTAYAVALAVTALATQAALFMAGFTISDPVIVAGLCVVAALAERQTVRLGVLQSSRSLFFRRSLQRWPSAQRPPGLSARRRCSEIRISSDRAADPRFSSSPSIAVRAHSWARPLA